MEVGQHTADSKDHRVTVSVFAGRMVSVTALFNSVIRPEYSPRKHVHIDWLLIKPRLWTLTFELHIIFTS